MDYRLFHAINGLAGRVDAFDDLVELASRFLPFVLVGMLIALWFWPGSRAERDERQWGCIAATFAAALAMGINQIVIRLWARPRPFTSHHVVLLLHASPDPSFPSDHATFGFAVAVAILLVSRRIGIAAVVLAVVLAWSRVYAGEHYVSDVVAGALVGSGVALAVSYARPLLQPMLNPPLRLARQLRLA